ncbi:MAG: histidine phosphatase family protein [Myxococcota bacterium]|nr:histidine phosphatase family protein [Myxococcota bacterium]
MILLRHAKSSHGDAGLSDHERPLTSRGHRDAPRVAQALAELGWSPDRVLSSNAERTRETWAGMIPVFGHLPAEFTPNLYLASVQTLLAEIAGGHQDASTLLVLGHNPGMENLAAHLSGEFHRMTTCNAALLESQASDWKSALAGPWTLQEFVRPKELKDRSVA